MIAGRIVASMAAILLGTSAAGADDRPVLTPLEGVGRHLFFDKGLSIGNNQACADCHQADSGWTGPLSRINKAGSVYEGSIRGRFGNRKPPSAAYATPSPILHFEIEDGNPLFIGGNFFDGRATGEDLGNSAADQAQGPFLNPVEQALPDEACVVHRACVNPRYGADFRGAWPGACDINWRHPTGRWQPVRALCILGKPISLLPAERAKVSDAYDKVALSIAAFEASPEVNAYSSKYDAYVAGWAALTPQEGRGLQLFEGKAQCAACHVLDNGPTGEPPLLTDFTFDNLGVPRNPDNPWYGQSAFNPLGKAWIDEGLGGFLATRADYQDYAEENRGKHKVPTLRNVDQRPTKGFIKAYMHNGYFKSLKAVVNFYNTRDVKPVCLDAFTREADALDQGCWPTPEVAENVNRDELGNLGLTDSEENAIVSFMRTLSDGYWQKAN
jgi:cytochrome c peroxidase